MTQEQLRDLILADESRISARVVLLTVAGLPCCKKLEEKSSLAVKLLERQFKMTHDDLMRVAGIKEEEKEFCLFELGAVTDESTAENWQWYQFTKRSGYISCFVSALESNKNQARGKMFAYQPRKQYMFDNEALDNCFHNVYQLLSAFYNDTSTANSGKNSPFRLTSLQGMQLHKIVMRHWNTLNCLSSSFTARDDFSSNFLQQGRPATVRRTTLAEMRLSSAKIRSLNCSCVMFGFWGTA